MLLFLEILNFVKGYFSGLILLVMHYYFCVLNLLVILSTNATERILCVLSNFLSLLL